MKSVAFMQAAVLMLFEVGLCLQWCDTAIGRMWSYRVNILCLDLVVTASIRIVKTHEGGRACWTSYIYKFQ